MAFTSKQISDREAEIAEPRPRSCAGDDRAGREPAAPSPSFRAIQEARTATVSSLAQSRFDWERVLSELALVIPDDVWLVKLTGTVSPAVQVEGGADVRSATASPGPPLEIVGCAPSQDAVAGFVAALEDIDGVTRVGVASSERPEQTASAPVPEETTGARPRRHRGVPDRGLHRAVRDRGRVRRGPDPVDGHHHAGVPAPLANGSGDVARTGPAGRKQRRSGQGPPRPSRPRTCSREAEMKGTERAVIAGVVVFVLAVAFYMMVLSPKRDEAAELDEEVTALEARSPSRSSWPPSGSRRARSSRTYYGRLVVLGKAVPDQADTASLLVQLNAIAEPRDVDFRGIALNEEASGEGASHTRRTRRPGRPPPTGEAAPAGDDRRAAGAEATGTPRCGTAATPAAPATEAAAANLPIGATVGPAGLPDAARTRSPSPAASSTSPTSSARLDEPRALPRATTARSTSTAG